MRKKEVQIVRSVRRGDQGVEVTVGPLDPKVKRQLVHWIKVLSAAGVWYQLGLWPGVWAATFIGFVSGLMEKEAPRKEMKPMPQTAVWGCGAIILWLVVASAFLVWTLTRLVELPVFVQAMATCYVIVGGATGFVWAFRALWTERQRGA